MDVAQRAGMEARGIMIVDDPADSGFMAVWLNQELPQPTLKRLDDDEF
jgi:hypothetical protein